MKVYCYFNIFLSTHNTCLNGYNMYGGVNMTNDSKSNRIDGVEFDAKKE